MKVGAITMANVLLPGEKIDLTYRFTNKTKRCIRANGSLNLIRYRTSVPPGDIWVPHVFKIADEGITPIEVDLPPSGFQDVTVHPEIPERFGGYVLVADLQGHGRAFASALVRSIKPDSGRVQYPTYALDATWPQYMNEGALILFEKLGVKGMRLGASYSPENAPEYAKSIADLDRYMRWTQKHDVTVMLTLDSGSMATQPLGRPRPWLTPDGKMLNTKSDMAWLPSYDNDFQNWVQRISTNYGWPKGEFECC